MTIAKVADDATLNINEMGFAQVARTKSGLKTLNAKKY